MNEHAPDPAPRRRNKDLLIVVAIAVAGLLMLAGTNAYLNDLRERALSGDWQSAVGTMRLMLIAAGVLVALSTVALAGMLWRIGSRTIAGERFPPPGAGISVTREYEGVSARRIGRYLQVSAALVALAGLAAATLALLVAPMA